MKKKAKVFGTALVAAAVLFLAGNFFIEHSPYSKQGRLKTALNLKTLPDSIKKLHCPTNDSVGEVVINCTFTIEKNEFNSLLGGYKFEEALENFFEVPHPPFEKGGDVTVKRINLENTSRYYVEVNFFKA